MTTTQEIDTSKSDLTPLMRQYTEIKARNPEAVLLYRMGDFYEMFNDDAKVASKVLGLTLTSRNHGGAENTPLAGFPFHALDRYAHRLVKAGYKIAVCEQTENPKAAKGIVKRDIIEVITAGTATEGSIIEEKANNFIVGASRNEGRIGIAVCDLSTGQFEVEELAEEEAGHELVRINPSEIVAARGGEEPMRLLQKREYAAYTIRPKIRRLLPQYLQACPVPRVAERWRQPLPKWHTRVTEDAIPALLAGCEIDHSVAPSIGYTGGRRAAEKLLAHFLDENLRRYARERNEPAAHATSNVSPYLHCGQISSLEIALAVRRHAEQNQLIADEYLEELIVRRESGLQLRLAR